MDPRHLEPEACEVWPEHWQALEVFLAAANQWRVVAHMGGAFYQGLDLPAVAAVMEIHEVEDRRTCLQQVQQIETGALEVMNPRR